MNELKDRKVFHRNTGLSVLNLKYLTMKKFLLIAFTFWLTFSYAQEETTFVKLSDNIPAFEFEKSPGVKQNISEYKGKLVLITFFCNLVRTLSQGTTTYSVGYIQ